MRPRAAQVVLVVLVFSAYFAVVPRSTPSAGAAIKITDPNGDEVVSFKHVRCVTFRGPSFSAHAEVDNWELGIGIIDFHGFRTYTLRYASHFAKPLAFIEDHSLAGEGNNQWSNAFSPYPRGTVAGRITFTKKGRPKGQRKIGIDFPEAYNSLADVDPPDQDLRYKGISGTAVCKKPQN
jgi:hypothetical protein